MSQRVIGLSHRLGAKRLLHSLRRHSHCQRHDGKQVHVHEPGRMGKADCEMLAPVYRLMKVVLPFIMPIKGSMPYSSMQEAF